MGLLVNGKMDPVSLELKNGTKTIYRKTVINTQSTQRNLIKEVQILCELGVPEWQPESKWASQSFIGPKTNKKP